MVLPFNGNLSQLQYWTQSNLPAVYDDSLSFYELLGKVISQLNTNTDFSNGVKDLLNSTITLINSEKWIDEKKMKDDSISRRTIVSGAVGVNEIDPAIMSQPTTAAGVQAALQLLTENKAEKTNVSDKPPTFTAAPEFTQLKQIVFGQEHLYAFHQVINKPNLKVVFSGDSTTFGFGLSNPDKWALDKAFPLLCKHRGFSNVIGANNGQSSMCTEHWNRTFFQNDLDANADLLVLRWGINDPSYDSNLTLLPSNGSPLGRRTASDFETSLRSGLTKIRQQRDAGSLSIVLMSPNSTSDDSTLRNESWHEQINGIIRRVARDFQCCFIDTYRYLQDSRYWASYMDVVGTGHIHPLDMMNLWIVDLIYKTVVPTFFESEYGEFGVSKNITLQNGWGNVGGSSLPAMYYKENYFKARLMGTIDAGTRTRSTVIATLPIKPTYLQQILIACENGVGTLYITTDGDLCIGQVPDTGWISLDGASYIF